MGRENQNTACSFGAHYILGQVQHLEDGIGNGLSQGDSETIHSMRIASRRLRNYFRLFKNCIPGEKQKGWQDEISRITRTLSKARDLDIQINLLNQLYENHLDMEFKPGYKRLLLRLKQQRGRAQEKVEKTIKRLQEEDILVGIHNYFNELATVAENMPDNDLALYEQAYALINQPLEVFLSYQQYVDSPDNADKLHAMRIAGKDLRYSMEIFAPLYGHALQAHIQIMNEIQELLGEFHDNHVWVTWLPKFIEEEQVRIRDFYGDDGLIKRLLPGLQHLIEDRKKAQEENYLSFVSTWEILMDEKAWQVLKEILRSRLKGIPAADGTTSEGKVIPDHAAQVCEDEYVEFEIELTPEQTDSNPDSPATSSNPEN